MSSTDTEPALPATLRLGAVPLTVADLDRARVDADDLAAEPVAGGFLVRDPWRTAVTFQT